MVVWFVFDSVGVVLCCLLVCSVVRIMVLWCS